MDNLTWRYNPQIFFRPTRSGPVTITLKVSTDHSSPGIGFYVFEGRQEHRKKISVK